MPPPAAPTLPVLQGFPLASRLPHEVEWCFTSTRANEHFQALTASNSWRRWTGGGQMSTLPMEDLCVAAGPGFAEALRVLRPLARAWAIVKARDWAGRTLLGKVVAWNDVAAMEEVVLALERCEVPMLLAGLQGEDAHDWLKQAAGPILDARWFLEAPASMITTTRGEQIGLTEVEASKVLTPALRKAWLRDFAAAHPGLDAAVRDKIAHALDVIAGKTFVIAVGKGKDNAWIGVAQSKERFRLADAPQDSVAAEPQIQFLSAHQEKPLIGFGLCRGAVLDALREEPLLVPILRGLLRGWESVPVAASLVPALAASLPEQKGTPLSRVGDAAAVAWWDEGLHVEARGGVPQEAIEPLGQASQFTPLIDGAKILLAHAGHRHGGDASWQAARGWAAMLHAAALAWADSGLAGPKENLLWPKFLAEAAPASQEIWDGGRVLIQRGLGSDGAFVLDAGGVMPALPGQPAAADPLALPRACWMGGIENRALISTAWTDVETGLGHLVGKLPGHPPPRLPAAEVRRVESCVSHFYSLPFGSTDLLLGATLNEESLLFGTSLDQQQSFGRLMEEQEDEAAVPGEFFRLDVSRLHGWLMNLAQGHVRGGLAKQLGSFLPWIEPLGDLRIHSRAEAGAAHHTLTWRMRDVAAP